jgi:hypothetical protein
MCIHFNKIYVLRYTMVICYSWIIIVKENENWLLFLKNSANTGFLAFGSNGKNVLVPLEEKVGPSYCSLFVSWMNG